MRSQGGILDQGKLADAPLPVLRPIRAFRMHNGDGPLNLVEGVVAFAGPVQRCSRCSDGAVDRLTQ